MSIFDERYNRLSEIKKKRAESAQTQIPQQSGAMASPFDGYKITSRPGARSAPTAGASTNHRGLDRAVPKGTALSLPIDVTYYRSGSDKARGKWIEFKDAGGNILHYQHLDSYGIFKPGQNVPAGSQIAVSGASGIGTGAHLHEEYWSPDGQNITESYWSTNAKGAKSGAAPVEYKKAGGNIFNVGTNALAREGRSALSGGYENLSRFEKVQMLKNRRKERERYDETIRKYSSPLGSRRGRRGNKVGAALGEKLDDWVGNENKKAEDYRRRMSDTAASSEARLSDENFMQAAIDGYQNARGKAEGWGNRNKTNPRQSPYARGQRRTKEDKLSLAEYMTDTEVLTYSGLLNTEGEKKAEEYLVSIREKLRKRAYEHKQYPEKFADAAKTIYNNPYGLPEGYYQKKSVFDDVKMPGTLEKAEKGAKKGGYIGSVVKSTAAGLGSVTAFTQTAGQAIKNRITGEYEPVDIYSPMFDRAREQQVIQRAATERDTPWVRFLKEAGFSIAGSLANAAVGGPVGEGASLALMGANAAGSSALDASERGLTPAQAATLGGVNGALEAATEMIPVKNIFAAFKSKRAGVELAKSILHSGFENAEQEAINTLAGNIADEMIAGDKSELMENAREYAENLQKERGLSNEKAISEGIKKAAFNAYIYDPLYSALSGAFSGAVQTGAAAAAGRAAADISDTVRAYSAGQNAGAAIDKLGYKVELTDNAELDGKVDKKKGIVYFNPEGTDFKQTVKHEISHMVENNEKYTRFKSFVKEEMPGAYRACERRVVDRLARVNEWREQRGLKKYKTDAETIEAETFAELAEVLKSDRLIRRFALGDDMPKTMRVIEFARDAGARLSEKLGTDNGWNTAARKWAAALAEVRKSESGTAQNEQRYKIAYTEENTPVVVVEEDILKGVPKEDWAKKAREALRQFSGGIRVGGRIVNVNRTSGKEYTNSRNSRRLERVDTVRYADKMRAANNADEIVKGSRNYVDEALNHARKDGMKQFARGNILMEIGGRKYNAEVVIGTNGENKQVLYDVINLKNADFTKNQQNNRAGEFDKQTPDRTGYPADTDSVAQKGDAVNTSIRKSNENDTNERYKIRDTEITEEDVRAVQSVGRKSVNSFSGNDVKATEGFARKYYREMGTKSPFFRAWFGDWRAEDKSPVRIANRRDAARGVVKNADTGWNVQVSGKVFNETKKHLSAKATKAVSALDYINSIIEDAVLLDSSTIPSGKTKSENSAMMHSLYAIADMGSGRELIKLYVEELNDVNSDGTIKRAYQLQNINKIPLTGTKVNQNGLTSLTQRNTYTVAQLFKLVKSSDKNFAPKSTSKVVNEDGTPKVVYHGTGEKFNVFDITKSRSYDETLNYDLPGFYFSESTDESGSYGENVGEYYIDIKRPYTGDTYALAKKLGSYRKAYDYLVSQGYDGVVVDDLGEGYNEYIVFGANQIKSVTDNVGTFDGGNPDVRYKLKDVDRIRSSTDALLKENKILYGEYDGKYFNSYSDWLAFRIDRVEEENKKLKQTRQTLERMANIAGEVHVDVMKISDYAAEVKKETSSLLPRREIAARLEKIYSDIAKSGADDDGSGAYRELFDLANDILSASDVVDRSMYERYADLREFLRNTPISLSKTDRADIPDWSDFVKRNRGRIRISEKGTGVDSIYEQLAAEYPEFFAESGYTHPADRLKHIEKVRDSLDPVYDNRRHTDDEAAILAQSMFSHYFSEENAPLEHQTLLELIRGRLEKEIAAEQEEKYKKEIERYKDRLEYYRFLDRNVAKRAKAAGGEDAAPEYIDKDVTDEYLYKYVKNIKFEEPANKKRDLAAAENADANSSTSETTDSTVSADSVSKNAQKVKNGVRVLRRKYADREHIVLDFDRPGVVSAEERKTWQYKASDAPEYADIIDRVKRRTKIEQNQYNGAAKEGTLAYDKHNIWRNMRKFFGDRDYAKIKELILDPLDDSKRQFEYIQEFYTNILYDKVVRELGIKEGSRLSALVQMYGEGVISEEDIEAVGAEKMEKIKKADRIFRGAYDGLLDTMNETRKKIYPHAQEKVKKIEEQLKEIRQEMFLIEAGYTSGDFSELSANQWESLRNIEIRRESANELIYRAKEAAKERIASLDEAIERTEAELFKLGNRKDLQKYQDAIARRDRLVVRKNEIMQLTEAKVDKLTGMAKKLTEKFDENSSVFKEKLLKRLVELNQREGELIGLLGTDEITYGRMIERRRDYYHHFEELCDAVPEFIGYMKVHANDKLSTADKIKGYINSRGIRHNHNIDNRLAGKSENTKPKAKWQSFAQRREGGNATKYDAVGGFRRYISAAAYTAAIDPNISIFRALADDLAKPIDGKPSNSNMNGFVDYLQEYANDLAGKSNKYGDRLIARSLGRNAWNRINRVSSRTKNNQVVYNAACSWAQILNVPQAMAYMREHPVALTKSMADTLESFLPGKSEVKERYKYSSFLAERFSDYRTQFLPAHKRIPAKIANFMLGALDEVGTKYIWNAAYRSAIIEGNKAPIRYADDVTRRMVAGRGIGEMPYYQKSKFIGMLIPFTLESGNVIDVYDDMRRDRRQKHDVDNKRGLSRAAAAVGAGVDYGLDMLVLFVANYFFDWVMTKLRGTDGGLFNPIADVQKGIKNNYGVLRTAGLIAGDFVGSFPSGSFLAGMLPEYGVELPWGFNLPSRSDIFGDSDPTRFGGGGVLKSAIKDPVHMLILPTGGAQVRKIEKAIYASYNGAVRTRSGKVKYELTDKSYFNIIRGLLYGTSALTESAEYYDKKEVNLHDTPDGFEYKHKSRDVTVGRENIKLEEDELDRFERVRLARYKRLAECDNRAFVLRNPYGAPKKEWSYERRVKYDSDVKRMLKVLNGLIDQGAITQERAREIYKAYVNGEETKVRGVEFYAPTKIERVKKFADFTPVQKMNYRKQVLSDINSGDMSLDDGRELLEKIDSKQWDFDAPVSEYITGDMKKLTAEEKKKIHSKLNSLATDFAKENWKERRDSWLNKWKGRKEWRGR